MQTRIFLFIIASFIFVSCNDDSIVLQKEIELLKIENDSLKNILTEVNSKYVFDHVTFRLIDSPNNNFKKDTEFKSEFVLIGFNDNMEVNISEQIENGILIKPKKLNSNGGSYPFEITLDNKINDYYINFNSNPSFGINFGGITISDQITAN